MLLKSPSQFLQDVLVKIQGPTPRLNLELWLQLLERTGFWKILHQALRLAQRLKDDTKYVIVRLEFWGSRGSRWVLVLTYSSIRNSVLKH